MIGRYNIEGGRFVEEKRLTPADLLNIIRRRKWALIGPALFLLFLAGVVALAIPSYYKSTSTILIEDQEIPQNFVMATVTSYAEQRLQIINQRIMSSTRLIELIKQFNLYADLYDRWTTEEIVEEMREDIQMETISAEVMDRRTGRATIATIAFTLSYEGKDPKQVQRVANELTSFFLKENLKVRQRKTKEATKFLEEELGKVKHDLSELDERLSAFKTDHVNELPELLQVNFQSLNNIELSLDRLSQQMQSLKEKEGYLQTQLASLSPDMELNIDRQRLEELKVELIDLETRLSDEHPDMIKTRQQIKALEQQLKSKKETDSDASENMKNNTYVTISSQLASTQSEIASVKRQIAEARKKENLYRSRIEATLGIEGQYSTMLLEQQNMKTKYGDLMQKLMEAKVAHGLEVEQKGERFTLIDPPRLPEKPFKPNRMAIALIGLILAMGASIGFASLVELSDNSIRNASDLWLETSIPVLAGIPLIMSKSDARRRIIAKVSICIGVLLAITIGVLLVHIFVMDLDLLWIKIQRKLAL